MTVVDLDDDEALDPGAVGAKAARLARLRRAGLPVAPGFVVTTEEARAALEGGGKALAGRGSGAARLAVMGRELSDALAARLTSEVERRFASAIVRSSSTLETGGPWAGAFSSFEDVHPTEIATAVRGVWASVFTVNVVELCERHGLDPAATDMGVLVQSQLHTEAGGLAGRRPDGTVEVVATRGRLSQLTAGWDNGVCATVHADGTCDVPSDAPIGAELLAAAAGLAHEAYAAVGDTAIEWAIVDGRPVLLQSARSAEPAGAEVPDVPEAVDPVALRLALGAACAPGALGAELVMPWLAAVDAPVRSRGAVPASPTPAADLRRAQALARSLTERAWRDAGPRAAETARTVLRTLRAQHEPRALRRLAVLAPLPHDQARRVVELLDGVAAAAVEAGLAGHAGQVWRHSAEELHALLDGHEVRASGARIGPDLWEPFLFATVAAGGRQASGRPGAPGMGAGPVVAVTDPHAPPALGGREVVVAERPFPSLAPLLWSASALVTFGGNPGAHLMEVATSLGVPAVVGVDPGAPGLSLAELGADGRFVAAVDGARGAVFLHESPQPVAAAPP